MSIIFVPQAILEELVCKKCKHYLSVFPIHISAEEAGALCGRCESDVKEDIYLQDIAYENFVKFLQFPCMYQKNGCNENLTPELLKIHEPTCQYDKFTCLNKNKCQWQGPKDKLLQHFEENHVVMEQSDPIFEFNINEHFDEVMLLKHNSEIFQVNVKFDEEKKIIHFFVKFLFNKNKSLNYIYNLKFISGVNSHHSKEYLTSEEENFKLEDLSNIFNTPNEIKVLIQIKHPFNNNEEALNVSADLKENPNLDWKMLAELECPVCYDHMVPPIFQCLGGHSICQFCIPMLTTCPTCRQGLKNTRNFVLEKISLKLKYPCKYYKQGCSFYTLSGEIRKHEDKCEYGPFQCPIKNPLCQWFGNACDFLSHVEENHKEQVLKSDRVECPVNEPIEKKVFIIFSKRVFILIHRTLDSSLLCTVQMVSSQQDTDKFKFELDLVDLSGNNMHCSFSRMVSPLSATVNPDEYLHIMYNQTRGFINNNKIAFKVRVSKSRFF